MEDEISLCDYIIVIYKRRWLLISLVLFFALASIIISFLKKPVYEASTIITLGKFNNELYTKPSSAKEIILSNEILVEVMKKNSFDIRAENLKLFRDRLAIKDIPDAPVLTITAKAPTPAEAKKIAEDLATIFLQRAVSIFYENEEHFRLELKKIEGQQKVFQASLLRNKELLNRFQGQYRENSLTNDFQRNNLFELVKNDEDQLLKLQERYLEIKREMLSLEKPEIISKALISEEPVTSPVIIVLAGTVLGFMTGLFVVFIREYFSNNPLELNKIG